MPRRVLVFTLVLCMAFVFGGCAKKDEAPKGEATVASGDGPKEGGTIVFGRGGDSVGLDPAYETDGNSFMVCDNLYEQLVAYKDETTDVEPGLAKSWDVSDDGKTYTFQLREGVTFHDGTPLNANAVVFSIGRMMKDRNLKFSGEGFEVPPQERPPEYWVSMEMDDTIGSIEATAENTVVFNLKRVEAPFIANMGMDFASIISPTAFLKDPKAYIRNPVGTGPFKFVKWVADDNITLEKFADYWNKANGGPYLDKVVFRAIPENAVRFLELKVGNIDVCQFPNPADIDLARKDENIKLVSQPGMNVGYLGFNHTKKLWQNLALRQAVAHAINRQAIVDNIYQGMGQLAKNGIPPTMWGYNDDVPGYAYDVELAKKKLAEAGYPGGEGLPELKLWSMPVPRPYNPEGLKVGIAMIGDLKKIGITANVTSYDWGTYLKRQREQPADMDMFQLGWTGDNGDPDNFLAVLFDGLASPAIRTQWKNKRYHELMLQGKTTIDQAKRAEIYKEAQQVMFDDVAVLTVAHSTVIWPMGNGIMNFKLHPTGSVRMKNVWKN
jgi:ABC-type transport system substrate-binding protein